LEEIIHRIDNWSIIKLLGGTAAVLALVLGWFSKYFIRRLDQRNQHSFDKRLEEIKGAITKGNNTLNTTIGSYLSSSQKILDKKIQAYETLWASVTKLKGDMAQGIFFVHDIFPYKWFAEHSSFEKLNNNRNLGPAIRAYSIDKNVTVLLDNYKQIEACKPYVTDKSYMRYYAYQAVIGRFTHEFIDAYSNRKLYCWKEDSHLNDIIKVILTEEEIKNIYDLELGSITRLVNLLEYKILEDIRSTLSIKDNTEDTISYLKQIESILSATVQKNTLL